MQRRDFLFGSAALLFGILRGLSSPSRALASVGGGRTCLCPPRVSLIIDDIGYSPWAARQFMRLGVPITFSILPRLPHSHDLAGEIHGLGHEVMLHQPMEPHNPDVDPGPGALYVGDSFERIVRISEENIGGLPFAVGVNNHMGSWFTECQKEVSKVLRVVGQRNLFYIDSLTTSRSRAYATAVSFQMAAARRDVFLDTVQTESHILAQLQKTEVLAKSRGYAIGIGHPFPETAKAIGQYLRHLKDPGVSLVYASRVIHTHP
jgi:uncharacterized protein